MTEPESSEPVAILDGDPPTFSAYLLAGRKAKKLTQAALGEQLGVRQPAVAAWECGRAYPSPSVIFHITEILDLDATELLRCIALEQESVA